MQDLLLLLDPHFTSASHKLTTFFCPYLGRNCASNSLPAIVGCIADAMPASCLFKASLQPVTAWSLVRGITRERIGDLAY